jgi:hypothetical protein
MAAAFDRAERDRVDNQPGLKTRLDREQPTNLPKHGPHLESLSTQRAESSFEPFVP